MPRTLLLADDSITMQKVVGIIFAHEDFSVIAVGNGDDAIAKARELRPDIVVADVVMPGRTGYDVCEALKSDPATKDIPVLLLAGTFEPYDEARAQAVGANGHIAKPFDSASFLQKVNELAGPPSPSAAQRAPSGGEIAAPRQQAPSIPMAPGIQPLPPLPVAEAPAPAAGPQPQATAAPPATGFAEPWFPPAGNQGTPGPVTVPGGLPQATLTPGPIAGFTAQHGQAGADALPASSATPAVGTGPFAAKTPGPSSLGGGYSSPFSMPSSLVSPMDAKTPGPQAPDAVVSWDTRAEAEDDWAEDIPDIDISAGPAGLPLSDGPQHDSPVEELEELLPEDSLEADGGSWPMSADGPIQDEISPAEPTPVEGYSVGGRFEDPSERDAGPAEEVTPLESPRSVFGHIQSEEEEEGRFAFGEARGYSAGPSPEPTIEEALPIAEVTPSEAIHIAEGLPLDEGFPASAGSFATEELPVAEAIPASAGSFATEELPVAEAIPASAGSFATEELPVAEAIPASAGSFATEELPVAEAFPASAGSFATWELPVAEAIPASAETFATRDLPVAEAIEVAEGIPVAETFPAGDALPQGGVAPAAGDLPADGSGGGRIAADPHVAAVDRVGGGAAAMAGLSKELVERIGWEVVPQVAELVLREQIQAVSRELIEKIAWEVVPQLAESIIRQEVERLIRERGIPGMEQVS